MSDRLYPISLSEADSWRARQGVTADEARKRYVQFVVLEAIAADAWLRGLLKFKGGNALRFVYRNPRSTIDLDFTAEGAFPDDDRVVRERLDAALRRVAPQFQVKARCQGVHRNPKSLAKTMPTYDVAVGYQLPGDRHFSGFEAETRNVSSVVRVEISLNDIACEAAPARLSPGPANQIYVCSLEDILAEKLRALLQQKTRKRNRPQDAFDIAKVLRTYGARLDFAKISDFFRKKAERRGVPQRKGEFDQDVKSLARTGYENLGQPSGPGAIEFEEAWAEVLALVARLDIPD